MGEKEPSAADHTLNVENSGDIRSSTKPLAALATRRESVALSRRGSSILLVHPHQRTFFLTRLVAFLAALATVPGALRWLFGAATTVQPGNLIAGAVVLAVSLLMASQCRWYVFDRAAGAMTVRSMLGRTSRPLHNIRSVQVVRGGDFDNRPDRRQQDELFQLNLVVGDAVSERVSVASTTDLDSVREAGLALSEFLNIPLRDETRE